MNAILASNSGNDAFAIEVTGAQNLGDGRQVEVSIRLRARHWDGDHDHPIEVKVAGMWLHPVAVRDLCDAVDDWVGLPLQQLAVTPFSRQFSLAVMPQTLVFSFGERDDTIAERHPVVTIETAIGKLRWEYHFVTDQSCLRSFGKTLRLEAGLA